MKRLSLILISLLLAACASQAPAPVADRTSPMATGMPSVTPGGPAYYTVKKGENLYRIALDHGIYYRDLAAWNNITDSSSIKEGQLLRIIPPGTPAGDAAVAQPIATGVQVESRPLAAGQSAAVGTPDGVKSEPKVSKEAYSDGAWERLQKPLEVAPKAAESKPETKPETKPAATTSEPVSVLAWAWPAPGKVSVPFGEGSKGIDIVGKEGDPIVAAADGKVFFVGLQKGYGNLLIIGHANGYISVYAHNRKILVAEKQSISKGQKVAEMGKSDSESGVKLHFEIRLQGKPVDPSSFLPQR